ncbi:MULTISPECIES: SpoVA/SpoVAEb family sporulation membrane protein [Anoxybacillus]|jgi:stage V sporulation protein AE|uniref:Stage V sporulation protein AE-like protein n=1 Tax=Anoxybacillus flavithermus (strain DSM 21510 / WK1) TaxID=491915 RepID=B7GKH2_ANOFW|nr:MULTISPECIES: SpoVA/SpoVAEb family sporulation membrane protein [Anoxybacillus]ACJ33385.1 Stage V sporulation protein AE-like protein [Anoxybacillus flavithermus WK1]AST06898.1 stage V sporulation protein AE-like protein [Anoxybacillus flavithermus]NNU97369.1 SpoVA/SpoVAEb family sporulation membrane protein [Anoxybacillus sp. EFIL]OSX54682.1 stage V sporulation protein AE-like protein [Anoxybacillus ayderensis]
METYVYAFVIGGTLALIGQLLLRKWSFIRVMTIFVFIGMVTESIGVYRPIQSFAHAGVETTLVHLGASCIQAVKTGDFTNVVFFLSFPIFVAWMTAIVCKPRGRIE